MFREINCSTQQPINVKNFLQVFFLKWGNKKTFIAEGFS